MNPKKLVIKNLFSYKKETIHFFGLRYALFKGKTGSGKSSIFDILCLALYGRTARKKYKSVVRDIPSKQKSAYVVYEFESDGVYYGINRGFGKYKGLKLFIDDKLCKLRTQTLVQEKIISIIGLDFDTFLNVCYFSQGDVEKFLSSTGTDRIDVVSKILNLSSLDKARKGVVKRIIDIQNKYSVGKGKLTSYQEILSSVDINVLNKDKSLLLGAQTKLNNDLIKVSQDYTDTVEKKKLIDELEEVKEAYDIKKSDWKLTIGDLSNEIKNLKTRKGNEDELNSKINELSEDILQGKSYEYELECKSKEVRNIQTKMIKIRSDIENKQKERKKYQDIVGMMGQKCPTCKNTLTSKNLIHVRKNIKTYEKSENKLEEDLIKIEQELKWKNNSRVRLDKKAQKISQLKAIKIKYEVRLVGLHERQKDIERLIDVKKKYKQQANKELQSYNVKYKKLKSDLKYYKNYDVKFIDELQANYEHLQEKKIDVDKKLDSNKIKMEQHKRYYNKIRKLKAGLEKYQSVVDSMLWWKNAYPNIKLQIIKDTIPFIEAETNRYLSQILSGKMIKFIIDFEKANNKLDVEIVDYEHNVKRIYEGWSGGEKGEMNLCVSLALNRLASIRANKRIGFIILDEKFANVDVESRNIIFETLSAEREDRAIYCISHVEGIESEFKQIVKVNKINKISNIEVHSNVI